MGIQMRIGEFVADVTLKDIKNIHLSVYPPTGAVRIAAPLHMKEVTIRVFALSKIGWIRKQKKKICDQERETPREFIDRESHYVWGKRYLLIVVEENAKPFVELKHSALLLHVRPGTTEDKKCAVVSLWHRELIKKAADPIIVKYEQLTGVKVANIRVQKMKTKWGSCNPGAGRIRLNSELAKKPIECLEYIILHEMVHFLEPRHNRQFVAHVDAFMPQWQFYREMLNRAPLAHEKWAY